MFIGRDCEKIYTLKALKRVALDTLVRTKETGPSLGIKKSRCNTFLFIEYKNVDSNCEGFSFFGELDLANRMDKEVKIGFTEVDTMIEAKKCMLIPKFNSRKFVDNGALFSCSSRIGAIIGHNNIAKFWIIN